jgi:hypothetical protein
MAKEAVAPIAKELSSRSAYEEHQLAEARKSELPTPEVRRRIMEEAGFLRTASGRNELKERT